MKIAEGTQYSKNLIADEIRSAQRKIKTLMKMPISPEHLDRLVFANERINDALHWLIKN